MTKRRRPTLVREEERADILTLARAGYTIARIAGTLDRSEATVARIIHEDRDAMRQAHSDELMASYMASVKVAAEQGNHKPALELMDRLGIIPETSRQRTSLAVAQMTSEAQHALVTSGQGRGSGPTIQIGIAMPGQLSGLGHSPQNLELPVISGAYLRPDARSEE